MRSIEVSQLAKKYKEQSTECKICFLFNVSFFLSFFLSSLHLFYFLYCSAYWSIHRSECLGCFVFLLGGYSYCLCASLCLSICLPVCLSVCLFVYLSACLSICLPVCLSVCLFVYLSACLSICLSISSLSVRLSASATLTFLLILSIPILV